jgi:hypothetical protein
MLSTILTLAAIVLLLVVLVPVGLALYQRIKPAPPEALPKPRGETKTLPPLPKTEKISVANVEAVVEEIKDDVGDSTENAHDHEKTATPEESRGTEMVQWYGMLHCTGGPLTGKRFIIEEGGLYIGRDPVLSTVVVDDSRVSKRHLRIVPRNGRVWAIDESSTNGTFLANHGNERVSEVQLRRGDTLVLAEGAATFVYQI